MQLLGFDSAQEILLLFQVMAAHHFRAETLSAL